MAEKKEGERIYRSPLTRMNKIDRYFPDLAERERDLEEHPEQYTPDEVDEHDRTAGIWP